ncbi:MAG TPA: replication-associated recombination protein A [candidate division Zixibacteria bacterium]|nr:replication-associated recombination protein A [candidate division Zixibacteria bacterium]
MDFFSGHEESVAGERPTTKPLADRMRPHNFDEFAGQQKIVGPGTPLRRSIDEDRVGSSIFWGPPGSGKTTLATLIAHATRGQFVPFSAVTASIKEVKQLISKAGDYYKLSGRRTYVFVDEIHRFNKAQQDAFLPYVESGDIILIGATTENPSFEVNSALLSRMRVYVLQRLQPEDLADLVRRALLDEDRGLGAMNLTADDDAIAFLAEAGDGDARRALSLLEATAAYVGNGGQLTLEVLREVHQKGSAVYDKSGEEHYNLISALHKTIRGGDPDAALYWLARMLEGGEDPMYILRRLIRFATEDIGLADPYALTLALNARDTYHFLGSPEGELAIAELSVYMACAPKSNAIYIAFGQARKDASEKGSLPVPLSLRNAPTSLMKELGYGDGYQYAHDYQDAITSQEYMPDNLQGRQYYRPTDLGREKKIAEYLERFRSYRHEIMNQKKNPSD